MGITESWLQKHHESFVKATMHPFILSIKQGTINPSSFKTWLAQDYIFVREFVPFVASVLLKACKQVGDPDGCEMETILGGLASLHDEISWFKKEASKWDVSISGIVAQEPNREYCRFLGNLMQPEVDYAACITAFWAIEMVYQTSFELCLEPGSKTPADLLETCQRWGNSSFKHYCSSLQSIADHCLEKAEEDVLREAEEAFVRVLHNEVGFWNMSYGDAQTS
ncbi:bifunctional TENA-E protein [Nymphaea colorata]|nr:bifunctional TENA-E protein [Nymphaea colorata]